MSKCKGKKKCNTNSESVHMMPEKMMDDWVFKRRMGYFFIGFRNRMPDYDNYRIKDENKPGEYNGPNVHEKRRW